MRFVVLGAGFLLAGCVQQAYAPPPPIELQNYPPPYTYRTTPSYRAPELAPLAEPLPPPVPFGSPAPADNAPPATDDNGAIPLQQMPTPAPDLPATPSVTTPSDAAPSPAQSVPASVAPKPPTSGPGSNVPLEGFRPMRGQTRPAP